MDHLKWQHLGNTTTEPYRRKPIVKKYLMPDGREAEYEVIPNNDSVCILAFTESKEVILAVQYRPGPDKLMLELPGGGVEKDEDIKEAAERELLEETGYKGEIQYITSSYKSAYALETTHSFVATNCRKVAEPQLDDFEYIEVATMSLPEFRKHIKSDELTDTLTAYLGLDHLNLL